MNHTQWLEWWTSRAETYFTGKCFSFSRPDLIKRLQLNLESKVLEIGYGYGRELSQWCKASANVYGVELSPKTAELAVSELQKRRIPSERMPTLLEYGGNKLPFENDYMDIVYSCFMTQHVSRVHACEVLNESLRVLRPSGLVLHEYFGDLTFWDDGEDMYSGDSEGGEMYNNAYRREELKTLAEDVGKFKWLEPWQITKEWSNWWLCVGKT